jgi:enamine deaminase RidA (YjgF/YER057c/UK114 family)
MLTMSQVSLVQRLPTPRSNKIPICVSSAGRELGLVLPKPPTPLGAYVEASQAGALLFVSGTLPLVDRELAITGRLGGNLSVEQFVPILVSFFNQ